MGSADDGIDLIYWPGQLNSALAFSQSSVDALSQPEYIERSHKLWTSQSSDTMEWISNALSALNEGAGTDEARLLFTRGMEDAFWKRRDQFQATLVNLGLVEQCSIFESAVTDTLRRIFRNRPDVLKGLLKNEQVPADFLIKREDRRLVDVLADWKLESFSRDSVDNKLLYFERNFDIQRKLLCDPNRFGKIARAKFQGKGPLFVREIFDKRHLIVHDLQRPVRDMAELKYYHEFLMQVLGQLLMEVRRRFKLSVLALGNKLADASEM